MNDIRNIQITSEKKSPRRRILSIDVLRGITIAGMIFVNNPGGAEVYKPFAHASWIGLTPADLVFPFFMFLMGITTYLSLRKYQFEWSWACTRKIIKRTFSLWGIGLIIEWLMMLSYRLSESTDSFIPFLRDSFSHLRLLGVLPRLGICYGLAAVIVLSIKHKYIPWIIAFLFVGYYVILESSNGWVHDSANILAIVDKAVLGSNHCFVWDVPDPEGVLSTVPALAHVLIGFCVGKYIMNSEGLDNQIERLFIIGVSLTLMGWLLSFACPVSKKIWSPTFSMITCGMCSAILALLIWGIDKRGRKNQAITFFLVFGVNPLILYVLSELLFIPLSILPLGGYSISHWTYHSILFPVLGAKLASLAWGLCVIGIVWYCGFTLYKKKVFISL